MQSLRTEPRSIYPTAERAASGGTKVDAAMLERVAVLAEQARAAGNPAPLRRAVIDACGEDLELLGRAKAVFAEELATEWRSFKRECEADLEAYEARWTAWEPPPIPSSLIADVLGEHAPRTMLDLLEALEMDVRPWSPVAAALAAMGDPLAACCVPPTADRSGELRVRPFAENSLERAEDLAFGVGVVMRARAGLRVPRTKKAGEYHIEIGREVERRMKARWAKEVA